MMSHLEAAETAPLCRWLSNQTHLEDLRIAIKYGKQIGSESARLLGESIHKLPSLKSLNLIFGYNNCLGSKGV